MKNIPAAAMRTGSAKAPVTTAVAGDVGKPEATGLPRSSLALYVNRQADNLWRYAYEQSILTLGGGVPGVTGIGLRALLYRMIVLMDGPAAIENGVRLRFANHIRLGRGVYLDQ